tara:strand:- start:183 stop:338 length:156 start_codon:yes stop_codon:yes gene_type:complete
MTDKQREELLELFADFIDKGVQVVELKNILPEVWAEALANKTRHGETVWKG